MPGQSRLRQEMGTARLVALSIALVWSIVLIVGAFSLPVYSSDMPSAADTLVEVNGDGAVVPVTVPLAIATIVAGVLWVKPWRNTAIAFQPDGGRRVYDKRHLLSPFEDKFTPGRSPGLLGRSRAVAICKDLDFPRTLRADTVAGARGSPSATQTFGSDCDCRFTKR